MKISIMQPYFFPYLGYFDLLYNSDFFVVYDTVQYIKQGWINRNRILHPSKSGWLYIHVPVNRSSFYKSFETEIIKVKIFDGKPWKQHIFGQLLHYKKEAPYYDQVIQLVQECFSIPENSISRFNMKIIDLCTQYLDIRFEYQFSSELKMEQDINLSAEERVLKLCNYFGAKEYVNLPGGVNLYHSEIFESHNVRLRFRDLPTFVYSPRSYAFEPDLSIIDVLMWNSPETVKNYLDLNRGKKYEK